MYVLLVLLSYVYIVEHRIIGCYNLKGSKCLFCTKWMVIFFNYYYHIMVRVIIRNKYLTNKKSLIELYKEIKQS